MTRKLWMAAALALAMFGGAYAKQEASTQPAQQTEPAKPARHKKVKKQAMAAQPAQQAEPATTKVTKHHVKKHKKNAETPAATPQQ